jgi:hypothetical protein
VLSEQVDEMDALDGIKRGVADVEAGRLTSLKEFEEDFRNNRRLPGRCYA